MSCIYISISRIICIDRFFIAENEAMSLFLFTNRVVAISKTMGDSATSLLPKVLRMPGGVLASYFAFRCLTFRFINTLEAYPTGVF